MELQFLSASEVSAGSAALYALVGFIIVLAVLALLVGIFTLSGLIFRTKAMSKEKLFDFSKNKAQPQPEFIPAAVPEKSEDGEIVAAITAAIAVILSEESGGTEKPDFIIRRISRSK